ncbi:DNA damage-inducible transcript 4 protein [Pangasianodon hypophthalmus]|uniref:DNA damage-inducible transcript 4 protein n=1 Tax=Pangasianodon hypophthalmus TaxID=310915 RepID=UPI000EFE4C02|nr:DNA damage-inducible transcript 4 protein [Pangasianodon hypophthalmus]
MQKIQSEGVWADGAPQRLSWSGLVQNLSSSNSIDSDSEHSGTDDGSDTGSVSLPDLSALDADMFYDPTEESLCKEVVQQIALSLIEAKGCTLHCSKLLIPNKLLEHIGSELVQLAASEPCGLRGALIDLCVQQGETFDSVGQIAADPCLVPTFQLTLVLRPESGGIWPKIQGLFTAKSSSMPLRGALKLSTGFRVIKRKLYSSEELLIEEC